MTVFYTHDPDQHTLDDWAATGTDPADDQREAQEARDNAIDRVERNADQDWYDQAVLAVYRVARVESVLTSLDAQALFSERPREPRAWGAVFRHARAAGWIEPTGRYVSTTRSRSHCRPVREWASRIQGGELP